MLPSLDTMLQCCNDAKQFELEREIGLKLRRKKTSVGVPSD